MPRDGSAVVEPVRPTVPSRCAAPADKPDAGRWANNRAENSHLPFRRRERAMLRFRRMKSLQKFASVQANVHNHFNSQRHLVDRETYKTSRSAALWLSGKTSWHDFKLGRDSCASQRQVAIRLTAPIRSLMATPPRTAIDSDYRHHENLSNRS